MDTKKQKWLKSRWCVVVSDSPTNGHIVRCRFLLRAVWVGFGYGLNGWKVRLCHEETSDPKQVLADLKSSYTVDKIMDAFKANKKRGE